jgi:hypothetical protein
VKTGRFLLTIFKVDVFMAVLFYYLLIEPLNNLSGPSSPPNGLAATCKLPELHAHRFLPQGMDSKSSLKDKINGSVNVDKKLEWSTAVIISVALDQT